MRTPTPFFNDLAELLYGPNWTSQHGITDATVISQAYNELKRRQQALEDERARVRFRELEAQGLRDKLAEECTSRQALAQEVLSLRATVEKLRPPEPKFRVGQVVHSFIGKSSGKIIKREHNHDVKWLGEGWCYLLENYTAWWHQDKLRALTEDEK